MRKFLAVLGVLVLLGGLAAGVWLSWPLFFPMMEPSVPGILSQVDAAITQGRSDKALVILKDLPENLSVHEWLRVEKRLKVMAEKTGFWEKVLDYSSRALSQYPGNSSLAAFQVWGLMKAGRYSEAETVGKEKLSGSPFAGLTQQAEIVHQILLPTGKGKPDWNRLKEQLTEPGTVPPGLFSTLTGITNDLSLRKNALLSALVQGRLDEAAAYMDSLSTAERNKPPFDQLQALMAFDAADWGKASGLLRTLASQSSLNQKRSVFFASLMADVYLHLGAVLSARTIYDQLIKDQGINGVPPSVLLNRSVIALMEKDPQLVLLILGSGLHTQGENWDLGDARSRVKLLRWEAQFQKGEKETVEKALNRVQDEALESGESSFFIDCALLKIRLFPSSLSLPRLWSLYHRHQDYAPLAERLIWTLMVTEDYPGANKVLGMFETRNHGPVWWSWYYRGLLSALKGDFTAAVASFENVPLKSQDYTLHYNWALSLSTLSMVQEGDRGIVLEKAYAQVTACQDSFPEGDSLKMLRSQVLVLRGQLALALTAVRPMSQRPSLLQQARDDLQKAYLLDPDNLKAAFFLREAALSDSSPPVVTSSKESKKDNLHAQTEKP